MNTVFFFCFFFNDTATTEIYTLSLHDALPIFDKTAARINELVPEARVVTAHGQMGEQRLEQVMVDFWERRADVDRKSTRLNSSHANISYAVFCLKKKKNTKNTILVPGAIRTEF